jgi:hypothetical protein
MVEIALGVVEIVAGVLPLPDDPLQKPLGRVKSDFHGYLLGFDGGIVGDTIDKISQQDMYTRPRETER